MNQNHHCRIRPEVSGRQTAFCRGAVGTVRRLVLLLFPWLTAHGLLAQDRVDYAREIRPILAANCFRCHGADEKHRQAGLRLDTVDGATEVIDGQAAIVPGNVELSELMGRITTHDVDLQMPPADTGLELRPEQIALLRRWISEGAPYQQHWAFTAPVRPDVPGLESSWVQNPIDAFVLSQLGRQQLKPSAKASASGLLRRLYLDLTGLPPTLQQQQDFEQQLRTIPQSGPDQAEGTALRTAIAAEAETLLSSPHFGEKWARHWLDAARYADSDGFEKDKPRFVWFYRDWVIDAMNSDKPYRDFLIEQLAGDLLPNVTQDQIIATGFLRNSMINEEGGIDPEQFRMEAMFDRMDAIGKAMLGLTIQCAQCHDHKYDPLNQRDYYRMFAYLNNSHESQLTVYTRPELKVRAQILEQISEVEDQIREYNPDWQSRLEDWARGLGTGGQSWTILRPQLDASGGQKHYLLEDGSVLAQGYAPTRHTTEFTVTTDLHCVTGFRLELLNDPNLPHGGPGRSVDGLCALSEFQVTASPLHAPDQSRHVKIASATADVNPPEKELAAIFFDKSKDRRTDGPIELAIDGKNQTAWGIDLGGGRSNVPRNAVFVPEEPLISESGFRLTFRLVQMHGGWNSDDNQNNNLGRFRFSVSSEPGPTADHVPADVRAIAARRPDERTDEEHGLLFSAWRATVDEFAQYNRRIESLWRKHPRGTTQLVLQERSHRRPTHILTRGDFLKPAEEVAPGVPQIAGWPTIADGSPGSSAATEPPRLQFARWIADSRHPTVARAIVNRIWQEYFGTGIVRTSEDLGTQGDYPAHPELLDWLAVELVEHNWSLKHIHRLIVNSATWQQASAVTEQHLAVDPDNRWLARGPRVRVPGEAVRDIFLAAGGLLNTQTGGPGVYPPAPEFLFLPPASYGPKTWPVVRDDSRYRRAVYTFRFRSVPYPVLENFDTPRGDTACVRRSRSNTPLQALTTLNEELFMDCSRSLALAAVHEAAGDQDRIRFLMRRCVARDPSPEEFEILLGFVEAQRSRFQQDEYTQERLLDLATLTPTAPPALPADESIAELAVWTAASRVVLNMDETITKE